MSNPTTYRKSNFGQLADDSANLATWTFFGLLYAIALPVAALVIGCLLVRPGRWLRRIRPAVRWHRAGD